MRIKITSLFITVCLSLFSAQSIAIEYLYKFSGGVNYWANGEASGRLGEYRLASGVNGVDYYYNGSRLGFWVEAKSGVFIFPNIKVRYQDIQYYGTGDIAEILDVEIAGIDLSTLLGKVESEIDFSYIETIASFSWPMQAVDLDMGLKLRVHGVNYGIAAFGSEMQRNSFYAPIPFVYAGVSKSFFEDNLSLSAQYAVLPLNGVVFETIDAFVRYKLPIEEFSPVDIRLQAGFQSFNFKIDGDSSFNFLTNEDGQFGFQSIVLGIVGVF